MAIKNTKSIFSPLRDKGVVVVTYESPLFCRCQYSLNASPIVLVALSRHLNGNTKTRPERRCFSWVCTVPRVLLWTLVCVEGG